MAAGAIVAGQCVDASAAADLFYSNTAPAISAGAPEYITQLERSGSGWSAVTYSGGSLVSTSALQSPAFATCDTSEGFTDGLTLGWMVAVAMVAAYSIHLLRRAIT